MRLSSVLWNGVGILPRDDSGLPQALYRWRESAPKKAKEQVWVSRNSAWVICCPLARGSLARLFSKCARNPRYSAECAKDTPSCSTRVEHRCAKCGAVTEVDGDSAEHLIDLEWYIEEFLVVQFAANWVCVPEGFLVGK